MIKVFYTLIFLLLLYPLNLFSLRTNVAVTAALSTNGVNFLEEFFLTYSIPNCDQILELNLTNYEFSQTSLSINLENQFSNIFILRIKTFELSNFIMPSIGVKTLFKNKTNEFLTPAYLVNQKRINASISNIEPIEEIYPFYDYLLWIIIGSVVILTGLAVFFILKIRKKKVITPKLDSGPQIDPYDEILKTLDEIKTALLDDSNYKDQFALISETIRRFLERVFSFIALEMASSEILRYMKKDWVNPANGENLSKDVYETMEHIIKLSDRVKYAKHIPTQIQKDTIIEECVHFVKITRELFQKPDGSIKSSEVKKDAV